jgi:hypothetical protein
LKIIYDNLSYSKYLKKKEITEEILQSLFGNGVLEPLETTDQFFKLEVLFKE